MKKIKTSRLLAIMGVCLLTASTTIASAQGNSVALNNKQAAGLPGSTVESADINSSPSLVVSERVSKNFTKEFAGVTGAAWAKTDNGFLVGFTADGIQNRVFLTKNGICQSRIRYYSEKELPADVRSQVKSEYRDFAITSVKEVRNHNATAYLVTIADATTWKVIRVVDGEADVFETHVKG